MKKKHNAKHIVQLKRKKQLSSVRKLKRVLGYYDSQKREIKSKG
jgi:hypothetical protein